MTSKITLQSLNCVQTALSTAVHWAERPAVHLAERLWLFLVLFHCIPLICVHLFFFFVEHLSNDGHCMTHHHHMYECMYVRMYLCDR